MRWDRTYVDAAPRCRHVAAAIDPGPANQAFAEASAPDGDGWLTVHLALEDLWHAETRLLAMSADAEVLAPTDLRERASQAAAAAASLYR